MSAALVSASPIFILCCCIFVFSCGKVLRNMDDAQFHAAKSGHSNFSESTEEKKPLTKEEKEAQIAMFALHTFVFTFQKLLFHSYLDFSRFSLVYLIFVAHVYPCACIAVNVLSGF